jgi:hypothetical protein
MHPPSALPRARPRAPVLELPCVVRAVPWCDAALHRAVPCRTPAAEPVL